MEIPSGLLNPIFIAWVVWGLFLGLTAIFAAKRLARDQLMTDNSPAMYVVGGLIMIAMIIFGIIT
ncbi:MAG TPA: hypothetical protein VFO00_00675, partial [Vitreimonas sp.]|nr:hypothetical protein [Vitreimonas sp.]